jgi:hypothetical protein
MLSGTSVRGHLSNVKLLVIKRLLLLAMLLLAMLLLVVLLLLLLQVFEEVDELMGPSLLPLMRQLLHHPSLLPQQQRQSIALSSSALSQQHLLAAAADVLKPSSVLIRATWSLPQQQPEQQQQMLPDHQQQQQQQQQLLLPSLLMPPGQAQLAMLLSNPAAALATAAQAAAEALPPHVNQRLLGVAPQVKMRCLLRLLAGSGAGGGEGLALIFTNTHAGDQWWPGQRPAPPAVQQPLLVEPSLGREYSCTSDEQKSSGNHHVMFIHGTFVMLFWAVSYICHVLLLQVLTRCGVSWMRRGWRQGCCTRAATSSSVTRPCSASSTE